MRYQVIVDDNPERLSAQVEELLSDGWTLHGGLLLAATEEGLVYAQALTNASRGVELEAEIVTRVLQEEFGNKPVTLEEKQRRLREIMSDIEQRVSKSKPDSE